MVVDRCDLPEGFCVNDYEFFQGMPTKVLTDHNIIDIGGREIEVLYTLGHSPGHLCFWEQSRGYLFTGDLVYKDILFAHYPSTDPEAYLDSLEKVAALPVKKVFPAHHSLDIKPEILIRMREAFRNLKMGGKFHHGSGTFSYVDCHIFCGKMGVYVVIYSGKDKNTTQGNLAELVGSPVAPIWCK